MKIKAKKEKLNNSKYTLGKFAGVQQCTSVTTVLARSEIIPRRLYADLGFALKLCTSQVKPPPPPPPPPQTRDK